jgi:hypothetical protein
MRTGALTPGSVALYRCVVTNGCSSIASAPASLVITGAPVISQQPQDEPLCTAPAVALFSIQAQTSVSDPGPFTYQWQYSTQGHPWQNVVNSENTTGATTAGLAMVLDAPDNAGQYRCVVTNACQSTNSAAATLSFGNAPVIGQQPVDAAACDGGNAQFDVSTAGSVQGAYQWRVETTPGQFVDLPENATYTDPLSGLSFFAYGTQTPDLSLSQITLGQPASAVRFEAVLTNGCGVTTTNPATLTVDSPLVITQQPSGADACPVGSASFSILATGTAPQYQWQIQDGGVWLDLGTGAAPLGCGGSASASAPNSALTDIAVTPCPGVNAYQVRCVVSNACGGVDSQAATYSVCYANCDCSNTPPVLNVNDFICFQSRFAAGDAYANCDGSTTAPVLNVNDFVCFQGRFAAGCP